MKIKSILVAAIWTTSFLGCPAAPPAPIDGGVESSTIPKVCHDACTTLRNLKCAGYQGSPGKDEKFGTADDVSCDRVCADLEVAAKTAAPYSLHPACIAGATSCAAVAKCNQ
jgi:hypothetical protein